VQDIGASRSLVDGDPFADVVLEEWPQLVEIALEKNEERRQAEIIATRHEPVCGQDDVLKL
jgi:hypothetical protein